eukprot:CAMPEP_0119003838 /NCGR_PEP_ID=MMETSP1176-20130426/794_1 /TAXON_ID=265551 /ORGANISM="Synedropsis recta cf, Strain CCMP1620" /LENGTH=207 /DNA_ID=CAMNT_0006955475 /DNA_START=52 /DNA_END=675 /DNA_ORIENTATION=-
MTAFFVLTLLCVCVGLSQSLITPGKQVSRRNWFGQVASATAVVVATTTGVNVQPAFAVKATQEDKDKANILKGYNRLNFLLDNWEEETTVCKTGVDNPYLGCDRTPVKVMDYLGYKSTDDPLFRADRTLRRLGEAVESDQEREYMDAMEVYTERSESGSGTAYISSWGESNPGGGKDRVDMFIERSKKDVIGCRDSLKTAIRILKIE